MGSTPTPASDLSNLPEVVCALDLETSGPNALKPDRADLAVVGIKIYTWDGQQKRYQPRPYEHYAFTDFPALQQQLDELPGLIIGHNLFNFDYLVLRRHLRLEQIIKKSVDTLHFLYEQSGGHEGGALKGLGLDDLSKQNFGERKTAKASTIPQLFKEGKLAEVLAYNERDCDLTFRVWWKMVSERHISAGEAFDEEDGEFFEVTYDLKEKDINVLTGATPRFTYTAWVEQLERDGWIVMPPNERRRRKKELQRQREEAQQAAKNRMSAMRAFIDRHLRDDIPRKYALKPGTYFSDVPPDPTDIEEARAVLERAGLPGSAWAEEVIGRLLHGSYVWPAKLANRPDDQEERTELLKSILVALANDGYIPRYNAGSEPDNDSISLAEPPPRPRTLAEQYVDRIRERYGELDAIFGPANLEFGIMRIAVGMNSAYSSAMSSVCGEEYMVFQDGSYVLDTDEIDLFDLQPKVLTNKEKTDLEDYMRNHPDEFEEVSQTSDE